MTFNASLLLNDKYFKLFNFSVEESDPEDSSNLIQMNDILNPESSSSSLDEEEKEDKKLYYISKKILKRYNNLGKIFKIESAKKREGQKRKKEQKKLNIMLGLKKIL